jgi:hypothetical protein
MSGRGGWRMSGRMNWGKAALRSRMALQGSTSVLEAPRAAARAEDLGEWKRRMRKKARRWHRRAKAARGTYLVAPTGTSP